MGLQELHLRITTPLNSLSSQVSYLNAHNEEPQKTSLQETLSQDEMPAGPIPETAGSELTLTENVPELKYMW